MLWFILGLVVGSSIVWLKEYLGKRCLAWEIVKYSQLRDDEWQFEDHYTDRSFWSVEDELQHDELLDNIQESRDKLTQWVQGVLHDDEVTV